MSSSFQLNLTHILKRSNQYFKNNEIVSRIGENQIFRYNYASLYSRTSKLAHFLHDDLKVRANERVASFGWNTHRHLELHFAVPCIGSILHTVNIRFSDDQIIYCINHAKDRILFVDLELFPHVEALLPRLPGLEQIVLMGGTKVKTRTTFSYEQSLEEQAEDEIEFPEIDEDSPAVLCYTTGTTGKPKGVLFTHRGIFLRSMSTGMTDVYGLSENETIMHVVPMYHISSWFMPYAAAMVGSKQVFPGAKPDSKILYELVQGEKVTLSDGVPSIWNDFLNYAHSKSLTNSKLRRLIIGGSAPPRKLIEQFDRNFGIEVVHAWGMTETYDSASASRSKRTKKDLSKESRYDLVTKQGLAFPGIEVDIVDEKCKKLPWDGKSNGELIIRGAWVVNEYYENDSGDSFTHGWLRTGDVATIDEEGYIKIVDRTKDLIRSGGEWVSSIELENIIMDHPHVLEVAVIAKEDEKWGERPVAFVVAKNDSLTREEINNFLSNKVPRWWIPEEIIFVDEIAKTSVGKFDKKLMRKRMKEIEK